jgi:hypothetical protein
MLLPSSWIKCKPSRRSTLKQAASIVGFLLGLLFNLDDAGDIFLRNDGMTFKGLHHGMYQNSELFRTIAVTTQNHKCELVAGLLVL